MKSTRKRTKQSVDILFPSLAVVEDDIVTERERFSTYSWYPIKTIERKTVKIKIRKYCYL